MFQPTHKLTTNLGTELVRFESGDDPNSGPLYTKAEWHMQDCADFELVGNRVLFQGQAVAFELEELEFPPPLVCCECGAEEAPEGKPFRGYSDSTYLCWDCGLK